MTAVIATSDSNLLIFYENCSFVATLASEAVNENSTLCNYAETTNGNADSVTVKTITQTKDSSHLFYTVQGALRGLELLFLLLVLQLREGALLLPVSHGLQAKGHAVAQHVALG